MLIRAWELFQWAQRKIKTDIKHWHDLLFINLSQNSVMSYNHIENGKAMTKNILDAPKPRKPRLCIVNGADFNEDATSVDEYSIFEGANADKVSSRNNWRSWLLDILARPLACSYIVANLTASATTIFLGIGALLTAHLCIKEGFDIDSFVVLLVAMITLLYVIFMFSSKPTLFASVVETMHALVRL